jgi:glucose/mannose-6-phosphate isomerase
MLDDLKYIHDRDASDALGVVEKQWQQLVHEYGVSFQPAGEIRNVVLSGMGGSGWPANYVRVWPGLSVPLEISSNYALPKYVNESTLVIVSSYSGNTEETLAALEDAEARGAQIVVMTAGGALLEKAQAKGYPLFQIPPGTQPRMSSFYFIAAFLELFGPLGLIEPVSMETRRELSGWLEGQVGQWRPDVPTSQNPAKQLALEIAGKTAIIYAGPLLAPVAQKMKICMNENAKNTAWWNQFPEFSHNEFIGWASHPIDKPFAVVEIRSNLEHPRVQKRFEVTERMLSGKRPAPHVISPSGDTLPQQIFWASMFGDFVCTYVALLNGVDPTPVDLVEKFKAELVKE